MARRTAQQLSVDELRTQISQRLRSNAAFSKTVYQDQPIIMTGSQLKSFVPDAIREARQLARTLYAQGMSVASVFYEQARLLAGYEDDFEFTGTFSHYYPSYEDMSNEQLRGYFAWRAKARQGNVEQGSLSFAYVYLYELVNLVGVASAREGYDAMLAFGSAYRRFDARFGKHLDAWIDDFVIYYGLDASLLRTRSFAKRDAAFDVLLHHEAHAEGEIFNALVTLGDYAIADSPFFIEHEAELRSLVVHAYRAAAQHHAKLKTTLPAKLAGRLKNDRLWLFERAVFANPLAIDTATYQISAHDTVYCRNGAWFRTRYEALERPLPWVTQLLETCECALREERAVHIDFSQLDHIRAAAEVTCEKLIVDDDSNLIMRGDKIQTPTTSRGDGAVAQTVLSSHESATGAFASMRRREASPFRETRFVHPSPRVMQRSSSFSLTPDEAALLVHLLAGGEIREFERAHACMASVLVDSINDKLYDEFADICIDTCTGEPIIIEDYVPELRDLLDLS